MNTHPPPVPKPEPALARLFLALWPDAATLTALRRHQRAWQWRRGSALVQPDQLHLTLHFIGPVPRDRLGALVPALQVAYPPFSLVFDQPALWRHGLAVLCAGEVPAGLARLHAGLADALHAHRLPVESRALLPHVTLARRAGGSLPPEHPPTVPWPIREYMLVESVLGRGADYRVLRRYPCQET